MSSTDTNTAAAAKPKRPQVALRDWIDASGNPVEAGKEGEAVGLRYVHLPTAKRLDAAFNPESSTPHADAVFTVNPTGAMATMLAIFGGLTLAGNVVNTAVNGTKGDPNVNPIPLIAARFAELESGVWADAATGVGGIRYDAEKLAQAIANAKGETDPAPYAAKIAAGKVDPKTGAAVAADTKGAISYGAYALRNGKVKQAYDTLTGAGTDIGSL